MKLDLSVPGVVEALIKEGRAPVSFGSLTVDGGKPEMSFWLPPQGTKLGDRIDGNPAFGFRFFSPEGEERGSAEMYVVPMSVGEEIRRRVNKVFEDMEK